MIAPDSFLDTNILLRHILHDHADHSPRATALIEAIERGDARVRTAETVVFETVFTLEKFYRIPRSEIRDIVLPIIDLPAIELPGKASLSEVFDLYVARRGLSFADCFHVVLMRRFHLTKIISFDRELDKIPGVLRIEPESL